MNKNKLLKIGILVLVVLILTMVGFTYYLQEQKVPEKYLNDSKYCEIDSDCKRLRDNCGAINKYSLDTTSGLSCDWNMQYVECQSNQCVLANEFNSKYPEKRINIS